MEKRKGEQKQEGKKGRGYAPKRNHFARVAIGGSERLVSAKAVTTPLGLGME
jgi:hypothetical protein